MQAVKEKLQSMNATRKAKQEAKAEEKVLENYYIVKQEKKKKKKKKRDFNNYRYCLNHCRKFNTYLYSKTIENLDRFLLATLYICI